MNDHLSILQTADGSATIYNALVGENYHSKHGAVQESLHVFVESGLKYFEKSNSVRQISILEVGFGTGLNFLLSADYCSENNITLIYTGIEAYPLPGDLIFSTNYDQYTAPEIWESFKSIYSASLISSQQLNNHCLLNIVPQKLLHFNTTLTYDVIYFDAFAEIHQPEMWSEESLSHITRFLKPGGIFVTYAITGNLKRAMKALNFTIEKAPGAPGKREMLRAIKML